MMKKNIFFRFFKIYIIFIFLFYPFTALAKGSKWRKNEIKFFSDNKKWSDPERDKKSLFYKRDKSFFKADSKWFEKDGKWKKKDVDWIEKDREPVN